MRGFIASLLFLATLAPAFAEGPIGTSGGPAINFAGCVAYQHADFQGAKFTLRGNYNLSYTGSKWNDQISSIACNVYCSLTAYQHRDFQGASYRFAANTQYVGDSWNDQISSARVRCK